MRWPWSKREDEDDVTEEHLERVRSQWPAVRRASAESVAHYKRNHIAETLTAALRGKNQ